jgi:fibrillarin-like pre-rRNA processing protein
MKETFPNVYREGKKLYTKNAVPGKKVYGEPLAKKDGVEYREWNPGRSKLGAAIANGIENMPISKNSKVLYLGASTGTTISHVSDIAERGAVYGIEFAERVFRELIDLSKNRNNLIPILADCRKPEEYCWVEEVDVVFVDVSQPDEIEISIRNAKEFLKPKGILMIAVKSQSIDVTKDPEKIYKESAKKLEESGFDVLEIIDLEPFEKHHAMIVARSRN